MGGSDADTARMMGYSEIRTFCLCIQQLISSNTCMDICNILEKYKRKAMHKHDILLSRINYLKEILCLGTISLKLV